MSVRPTDDHRRHEEPDIRRRRVCSFQRGILLTICAILSTKHDQLAFVKNPLNVLQEIELAPVAGRSGHLPLPLQ